LAGGFATRLWPISEKRAKPLLNVAGTKIISRIIKNIPVDTKIIISTNKFFENDFKNWKNKCGFKNIEIFVEDVFGEDEKIGALRASALAMRDINDDLFLLAGDNLINIDFDDFLKNSKKSNNPTILGFDIKSKENAKKFGVIVSDESGKFVKKFEEKPQNPKSSIVSTAFYFIQKSYLNILKDFSKKNPDNIGNLFSHFLEQKIKINLYTSQDKWFDIGSFDQYLEANIFYGKKENGNDFVKKGDNVQIINSKLKNVVIEKNCKIVDCEIKNCVILENCNIKNCNIKNSVIDKNCTIISLDIYRKMIRESSFFMR